jgi:hypothetical protein
MNLGFKNWPNVHVCLIELNKTVLCLLDNNPHVVWTLVFNFDDGSGMCIVE